MYGCHMGCQNRKCLQKKFAQILCFYLLYFYVFSTLLNGKICTNAVDVGRLNLLTILVSASCTGIQLCLCSTSRRHHRMLTFQHGDVGVSTSVGTRYTYLPMICVFVTLIFDLKV